MTKITYAGESICVDNMGRILYNPKAGKPMDSVMDHYSDVHTGALATTLLESKAITADAQVTTLRRWHRMSASLGGTALIMKDKGIGVSNEVIHAFIEQEGIQTTSFAPGGPTASGSDRGA